MSWPLTRLGDHCEIITKGTTPTTLGLEFADSGIPFLRVQNVANGSVNYERETLFVDEKTHRTLERSQIWPGDVLVSIAGTIGRAGVVPDRAPALNCNQALAIVRTKGEIFRPFLRHWLESTGAQAQMRGATVTGTISNLSLAQVGSLKLSLPPLHEQQRIAELLDRAEALRAKRRASLTQLASLTQSVFFDLFGDLATNPKGWPIRVVGDMVLGVTNGMTRRRPESDSGANIVLRLRDIRSGWIDFSDVNRITLTSDESSRYEVLPGDILFIRVNGNPHYVGRCALFSAYPEPVYFNDHIMRVTLDRSVVSGVFLTFVLNGPHGKREIASHRKTSAGQHTINQDGLSRLRIPLPPLRLQDEFARRVAVIEKLRTTYRLSLAALDVLFATLQHRAFRGEL